MKPVRVPTCSSPAMIILPPNHRSAVAETYIDSWKMGVLRTAPLKVRVAVAASSSLTAEKRLET